MFSAVVRRGGEGEERVELRILEQRHASVLHALVQREHEDLRQTMWWADLRQTQDDILTFIRGTLERFAANKGFSAGIWVDGSIAGMISLHRIDWRDRVGEIGYWLGREFRGRGIVTDAARAVTAHALVELDLHRVEIRCAVENTKSSAIPKRLGFTLDGVLRQASLLNGTFRDHEIYSMLRPEFRL